MVNQKEALEKLIKELDLNKRRSEQIKTSKRFSFSDLCDSSSSDLIEFSYRLGIIDVRTANDLKEKY